MDNIWYHGTPDVRELQEEGGFTQRYIDIDYVDDIDGWRSTQDAMKVARESGNDEEYFKLLEKAGTFRKKAKIRKPVFLTDIYSVAKTYADPQRAFDYQNSVEKVLKVTIKPGKGVTINAPGSRFRFIDIDNVRRGFLEAGVDGDELDLDIDKLNFALGVDSGIRTNDIAALADWLGFDYVDVVGVLDSYHGGKTKSTVRMVMDPNNISIVKDGIDEGLSNFVRRVIRESIILENAGQAEKVLRMNDVPLDDPDYLEFKQKISQNNNIGYLGFIVKLSTNNRFQKVLANDIYDLIIANKNILNKLPKPLMKYDDYGNLRKDLDGSVKLQLINKLSKKLTNEKIKNELVNYVDDVDFINNIEFFLKARSADRKEFMEKTDKYQTAKEFVDEFATFVNELRLGFKYGIVLNKVSSMDDSEIKVLLADESRQMILARILKYSASREIGSKSWCIVGEESQFNDYTKGGNNYQYFLFNFNSDIPANEKMIAFTMDKDNQVTASHDRYDKEFEGPVAYLSKLGIMPKVYEINSRERVKYDLDLLGQVVNRGNYSYDYIDDKYILKAFQNKKWDKKDGKEVIEVEKDKDYWHKLKVVSKKFLKYILNGNNLDILIGKFENYPENVYSHDSAGIAYKNTVNIVQTALHDVDKSIDKNLLVDTMKKVYMSNFEISKDTKWAIMHFLKDNGVDVLKLSQQVKSKTGQDLTNMEFAMLNKQGENLRPNIQNKLAAIRRGEDVNMNIAEINYAIENGFTDIIKKYYQSMLPGFTENQLSYEDMQVYQKLGMLDQVEGVLSQKANIHGDDVLNSIEKSVVDISGRKASIKEVRGLVRRVIRESFIEDISNEAIAYHVSPNEFSEFDSSLVGSRQGAHRKSEKDRGIFFTKDQWSIDWMKDVIARDSVPSYVYKCKLTYNKPYTLNDFYSMINSFRGEGYGENLVKRVGNWNAYDSETEEILKDALGGGYDSIVFGDFIVVFDGSQVEILDVDISEVK